MHHFAVRSFKHKQFVLFFILGNFSLPLFFFPFTEQPLEDKDPAFPLRCTYMIPSVNLFYNRVVLNPPEPFTPSVIEWNMHINGNTQTEPRTVTYYLSIIRSRQNRGQEQHRSVSDSQRENRNKTSGFGWEQTNNTRVSLIIYLVHINKLSVWPYSLFFPLQFHVMSFLSFFFCIITLFISFMLLLNAHKPFFVSLTELFPFATAHFLISSILKGLKSFIRCLNKKRAQLPLFP